MRRVSASDSARNGLWFALLAEQGFQEPAQPIEGPNGFMSAMGEIPNWDCILGDLGKCWELANNAYKPNPAVSWSTR
jgi:2-methylcitrate dehydratase PrpD